MLLAPDSDDASVLVDRDRLTQVLTNILSNAAKFSPRGAAVHVTIRAETDSVHVTVRDRGPGIAPEFQPRIFQRFAQADSSDSRAKGGTGLGLSIAKTIMERLGGSIGFESVYWARAQRFSSRCRCDTRSRRRSAPATTSSQDRRCCCVKTIRTSHGRWRTFLKAPGCESALFRVCGKRKLALDRARYDVALVDLHLADADGLELVSDLRSHGATRSLPVIIMTAQARTSADADRLGALQLADWLQKPIDPSRLLDAIHGVLFGLRGRRARILHVEDDESLTELVEELLSDEADVICAHSLAEARGHIDAGQYDLVILDAALGDGSGLDLLPMLHRVRRRSRQSFSIARPKRAASFPSACRRRW